MKISDDLIKLASYFPCELYVVGGAVRCAILGYPTSDIDLASNLTPDEVFAVLDGSPFTVAKTSAKLGTLKISSQTDSYEYTTFRIDNYKNDGSHLPSDVKFTRDILQDAYRRDFTINALYYGIKENKIWDFFDGRVHIGQKIIKTPSHADSVLKEDALRILRMVRLSAELGFNIDDDTYTSAKRLAPSIANIAIERIRDELDKMLVSDTRYGIRDAHISAINMLIDIGIMDIIIPELLEGKGVTQRADYHKYDVLTHSLKTYEYAPPEIRLVALLHDISKPRTLHQTGRMAGHDIAGAKLARAILNRLKYPKQKISYITKLIKNHMYDINGNTSERKMRLFVLENHDIIADLIKLKNADYLAGGIFKGENPTAIRLRKIYNDMRSSGVPFYIKDLSVNGNDLVALGIPAKERGALLQQLLRAVATDTKLYQRDAQLNYIIKMSKQIKNN